MSLPSGHSENIAQAIAAKILEGRASPEAQAQAQNSENSASVIDRIPFMNPDEVQSQGVVVMMAEWCGVCKGFKPRLEAAMKHLEEHGSPLHFDVHMEASMPDHIKNGGLTGYPTVVAKVNHVPHPFEINHGGTAGDFVEALRAAFPDALNGVPPLQPDLAGGSARGAPPGFSPIEMSPLFGGGHRRRSAPRRVAFAEGAPETKTFVSDDEEDSDASIAGGGILRTIGQSIAKLGAPAASAEPEAPTESAAPAEPAAPAAPSGGAIETLRSMPLAARCALITLARMPEDVRSAFGPGAGTVRAAMTAPASDGTHSVVIVLESREGKALVMAGQTPPGGCNTLEGSPGLDSAAADRAIAKFRDEHDSRDATAAVSAAFES